MRTRQPAAGSRDARSHGSSARASNGAGAPAAPGRDPQIGHIFRNMRAATRLSREAVARRLATTPATIENLETGAVLALPHWRETVRIVRSYCDLLRLDPEPLLWRMRQLLQAGGSDDDPPTRPPGPPPLRKHRSAAHAPRRRGRGVGRILLLATPPVVVAALAYFASVAPASFYQAISQLPAPMAGPARAALDYFVLHSAPRREGLRWIDVGDPQLRKVDKLPIKLPIKAQ
jgi:cytoskeletal protein RodZ